MKIAFIDSGIGGLSTLHKFFERKKAGVLYYADQSNMPYGAMSATVLRYHLKKVCDFLIGEGAEVIVLACNTATAVAVEFLREQFSNRVFIGSEPAVKPAMCFEGDIIVMATPLTLQQPKFERLIKNCKGNILIPDCRHLADCIEKDYPDFTMAQMLIDKILLPYFGDNTGCIVLGCTHYVFLKEYIKKKYKVPVVDGSGGVVRQLIKYSQDFCKEQQSELAIYVNGEEQSQFLTKAKNICKDVCEKIYLI